MVEKKEIKDKVGEHYARLARQVAQRTDARCCSPQPSCCPPAEVELADSISAQIYAPEDLKEIPLEAALASAGCGSPVALAELHPGEVVLDLGSGGGIDVLLSARRVGPAGKAYGLDMVDEMLELARQNQRKAGIENVEFLKGEMEDVPLPDNSVDVIISNCVVNLSPDKDAVFREAYRVLKPGGRLAVSDIVYRGGMTEDLRRNLEMWAGCLAGALREEECVGKLEAAGFQNIGVEVTRVWKREDLEGTEIAEAVDCLGSEARQALPSFVSAFVRAQKPSPRASGCCG
ncbi:MAG: arsenite S-adenosylmethyltransferase [Dehalococcoidia bacterium SM23_28_1]|nr:MAG: arsenite S-adenosylmethyltransferase [Dehalococcoidia bacterium SM23_28_1]